MIKVFLKAICIIIGLSLVAKADEFSFETYVRTFGFTGLESQPAIFSGQFELNQEDPGQESNINKLNFTLNMLEESGFKAYKWSPVLREKKSKVFGWATKYRQNIIVEIEADAYLDQKQVQDTSLANLGNMLRAQVALICSDLPEKLDEEIYCKLGHTSGFEMPGHDNILRRSFMIEPLSNDKQFSITKIKRIK